MQLAITPIISNVMHVVRALLPSRFLINHYSRAGRVISFFYGCLWALCLLLASLHYFRHGEGRAGYRRCRGAARAVVVGAQQVDAAAIVHNCRTSTLLPLCPEQDIDAASFVQEVDAAAVVVDAAGVVQECIRCGRVHDDKGLEQYPGRTQETMFSLRSCAQGLHVLGSDLRHGRV